MINGSFKPCPACGKKYDMSVGGEGTRSFHCPHCRHPVVVRSTYTPNAPGHEEHDDHSTTIIASGKIGKNKPCPCGSGRTYSHCCGKRADHRD